ncbi:MAG: metal ABC transporter substrate-binding protein [Luteolibacter sp.]|jgi:ABC-type Zn uptake system ZnuABC Zn-binding protein ZnuA|nr:metal ABC transporter substrate-binding protein [Luteolibacter sp.]
MNRLLLLSIIALVAACKPEADSKTNADAGKLRILASFLPVHAHAAAIAGDRAIVQSIVSGDVGAHGYSPRPADMERIARADVLVFNGAGMEPWLDDIVRHSSKKNQKRVDLSAGIELIANPPVFGAVDSSTGEANPHLWLDPLIVIRQVEILRDALVAVDPEGAGIYQINAAAYIASLRGLDAEFKSILGPLPSKKLVTFHDAFPYLAKRYGLESIGYISEFPERDPAPAELAALIDRIRASGVKVIFAETGYEPALLQRVASEAGAKVSTIDTLEVGQSGPDAYLSGMRKNLESLRTAFAP